MDQLRTLSIERADLNNSNIGAKRSITIDAATPGHYNGPSTTELLQTNAATTINKLMQKRGTQNELIIRKTNMPRTNRQEDDRYSS